MVGHDLRTPFAHSLAEHFPRFHRRSRAFLLERLRDPNPYLVAYAFKCLVRCGPIDVDDIPKDVLARSEEIKAQRIGCIVETLPLGRYIREYFPTTQCHEQTDTT